MPTMDDVASLARVSRMTVSRVINSPDRVREETREKVLDVIKELGYRPNLIARGLVTKRSHTIAHVIASISNPYHPKVVQGVEDACYDKGYNVILCNANVKKREEDYIGVLIDKSVDGVIFHHLNINTHQAMVMEKAGIKCVCIDNERPLDNVSNILLDQKNGAYMATKYLIELGHRNIGIIRGRLKYDDQVADIAYEHTFQFAIWKQRLEGFQKAMDEYGLKLDKKYMLEGDGGENRGIYSARLAVINMIGGREGRDRFLSIKSRPTAIYAQNDQMAIGAISGAMECGCDVPVDLSVIGQDGLDISESLYPGLTTIEQPRYEIGYTAAKMLIDLIEGRQTQSTIRINSKLVVRQSTECQ